MTPEQVDLARHALGLTNGRKQAYRNYFVADPDSPNGQEWMSLVDAGLAKMRPDATSSMSVFWLMLHAATTVLEKGEHLDMEDFPPSLRAEAA